MVFADVGGFGALYEVGGVGGDRSVIWGKAEELGGKLVDHWVNLYDCGIDAVGDKCGRRGTDA